MWFFCSRKDLQVLHSWALSGLGMSAFCLYNETESYLEKAMAPHSSTLAWKIPWAEEPGRLQLMGSLSQTWLSDFTFTFHFHALEKEMATHSSVLAWRIPGTGEPGGVYGISQSRTRLKRLSSSSSILSGHHFPSHAFSIVLHICLYSGLFSSLIIFLVTKKAFKNVKQQWDIIPQLWEWLSSRSLQITNVGEDMEKREPSHIVDGKVKLV